MVSNALTLQSVGHQIALLLCAPCSQGLLCLPADTAASFPHSPYAARPSLWLSAAVSTTVYLHLFETLTITLLLQPWPCHTDRHGPRCDSYGAAAAEGAAEQQGAASPGRANDIRERGGV